MNEQPAPPATDKGTRYMILESEGDKGWSEAGFYNATSAEQAVRGHVASLNSAIVSSYVAVPERSWKPVKVTVETTKTVKLG